MSRSDHVYDLGNFGEAFTPNEAVTTSGDAAPTFNYSNTAFAHSDTSHEFAQDPTSNRPVLAGLTGRPAFTLIQATQIEKGVVESPSDYKGRYRVSGVAMADGKTIKTELLLL